MLPVKFISKRWMPASFVKAALTTPVSYFPQGSKPSQAQMPVLDILSALSDTGKPSAL